MIVDLGENESSELTFGEGFVLVKGLAVRKGGWSVSRHNEVSIRRARTYIWLSVLATSVQTVSMSSFNV